MNKTPRGRLRELNNQGNLGYLKSGRGRLRELSITNFKSHFKRGFTKVVVTRADPSREWSQEELRLYMKFIYSSFQGLFLLPYCFLYIFPVHASSPFLPSKLNWTLCRLAVEWYLIWEIFLPSRRWDVAKSYIFTPQVSLTTSFSLKKNHNRINKNKKLG